MAKVTFDCDCPQSVVTITIQKSSDPSDVEGLLFRDSGSQTIDLSKGDHDLSYRAVGTKDSHVGLKMSKGGTLDRDVDRTLPPSGRMSGLRTVTVALALLLIGRIASAQSDPKPLVHDVLRTVPAAGLARVPGVSFDFEATSTEKKGSVSILAGTPGKGFTAGVTVSGPLDDSTKTGTPLTKSGLSSGAAAELGLHWFIWRNSGGTIAEAQAICKRNGLRANCDDDEIMNPIERLAFLHATGADTDPIVIDVTASRGRNTFKYLDSTYAASKEAHVDSSFSVAIGRFTPRNGLISAGYAYERGWEAGSAPRNICTPISGSTSVECRTMPVGPPTEDRKHELSLEQRVFLGVSRAAIAPRASFNVRDRVTTLTVPVYFFATKDSNLTGGIKASWNSKDRDTSVAVFIGPAFKVFK